MDNYLAILDKNTSYVKKLAGFIEKTGALPFRILAFDDLKKLEAFCIRKPAEVLLAGESFKDHDLNGTAKQIIFLTDGSEERLVSGGEDYPLISRYQAASEITGKVLKVLVDSPLEIATRAHATGNGESRILAFFAPGPKGFQTGTALKLCRILAKREKVIYMGFEPFSGFKARVGMCLGQRSDVTELVFFLDKSKDRFRMKLSSMVGNDEGVDYISPPGDYSDFMSVTAKEWVSTIKAVCSTGVYDTVVLDLHEAMQGLFSIMDVSDRIITVVPGDKLFAERYREFRESIPEEYIEKAESKSYMLKLPPGRDHKRMIEERLSEILG